MARAKRLWALAVLLASFLLTPAATASAAGAQRPIEPVCEDLSLDPSYFSDWIHLRTSPHAIDESDDETDITITATINGEALDTETTVALWVYWEAVNIEEDVDFRFKESELPTITIPAGQKSGCVKVDVEPIEDNIDEGDGEHLIFEGTHSGGKSVLGSSGLWINDNDTISKVVSLEVHDSDVSEDDCPGLAFDGTSVSYVAGQCFPLDVQVRARLSGAATARYDINVKIDSDLGGTASGALKGTVTEQQASAYDYLYSTPAPFTLTIPAGSFDSAWSDEVQLNEEFRIFPIDDDLADGDKTITLSGCVGGTCALETYYGYTLNPAVINFLDDEPGVNVGGL